MGRTVGWVLLSCLAVGLGSSLAGPRSTEFAKPPPAARPWVYAFWMEGNVTRKGITSDLEAMAREGVGGLLLMDGALGNPKGPYRFMSPSWRKMFSYMVAEAGRLGLKVDLNDGPGWSGSGGPWVKPEQATQTVITSETIVDGSIEFPGVLAKPGGIRQQYYKDIAVIAYPAPGRSGKRLYRIPGYTSSKSFAGGDDFAGVVTWPRNIATAVSYPPVPANQRVESTQMLDLTDKMDVGGRLTWKVPPGRWLVLGRGRGGFAVGMNGVVVFLYGQAGEIEPLLVYSKPFGSFKRARSRDPLQTAPGVQRVLIGVIYKDRTPYLFVGESLVAKGPESRFPARGGGGWADRRIFAGDLAARDSFESVLISSGHRNLLPSIADKDALPAIDVSHRLFWRSGTYVLSTGNGKGNERIVKLPPAQQLQGRWEVQFDPKLGGPRTVWFDRLESWSLRPEKGIRFYSGTAVYRQSFRAGRMLLSPSTACASIT